MFEVGDRVVDAWWDEQGFAAVGVIKRAHLSASVVEWPDGQLELVSNDELRSEN